MMKIVITCSPTLLHYYYTIAWMWNSFGSIWAGRTAPSSGFVPYSNTTFFPTKSDMKAQSASLRDLCDVFM